MNFLNWWNSKDAISLASTTSQVAVALIGIIALVLGIRSSQLQDRQQQQNLLDITNAKKEVVKANERTQQLERGTATLTIYLMHLGWLTYLLEQLNHRISSSLERLL